MSAFLLCFAAWSAIALGMDRHHEDALGQEGAARRLGCVQRKGRDALAVGSNLPDMALTFMNKRCNAHRDSLS